MKLRMIIVSTFLLIGCTYGASLVLPNKHNSSVWPRLPLLSIILLNNEFPKYDVSSNKIIGGEIAQPNSLPFQVSLQRNSISGYSHICGASILNENVTLCAAHCVDGMFASNHRIVAGEHSLSQQSGLEQVRTVATYYIHGSYGALTFRNDIALVFVSEPLDLNVPSVKAINLPAQDQETPAGTALVASGWGATISDDEVSDELRRVELSALSDDDCRALYSSNIFDSMICAGAAPGGGVDTCQGDSGGPLFTENPFVQIGIVSWGQTCITTDYPGVYTEVSQFIDWIEKYRDIY